jgi:nucleotide-binding universal stress UspA family protein
VFKISPDKTLLAFRGPKGLMNLFFKHKANINMKTIIVATDYSPVAENAVIYAANIAKDQGARLIVFNSFSLPVHASNTLFSAHAFQEILDANLDDLKKRTEIISKDYNITVIPECIYSFVEDEILGLIEKYSADLVVLGMQKKTVEQSLWGNTTTAAIKKLKFPVLAVPEGAVFTGIKNALFACDDLTAIPASIFSRINDFAARIKAEIEIFHVDETLEKLKGEDQNTLPEVLKSEDSDGIMYFYKNVRSNAVIEEIEKEIIAFKADLLIMIPRKHGFWDSIVHRSKTRVMAAGLQIPLLSIPV